VLYQSALDAPQQNLAALLAVLKTGACYVLLNRDMPALALQGKFARFGVTHSINYDEGQSVVQAINPEEVSGSNFKRSHSQRYACLQQNASNWRISDAITYAGLAAASPNEDIKNADAKTVAEHLTAALLALLGSERLELQAGAIDHGSIDLGAIDLSSLPGIMFDACGSNTPSNQPQPIPVGAYGQWWVPAWLCASLEYGAAGEQSSSLFGPAINASVNASVNVSIKSPSQSLIGTGDSEIWYATGIHAQRLSAKGLPARDFSTQTKPTLHGKLALQQHLNRLLPDYGIDPQLGCYVHAANSELHVFVVAPESEQSENPDEWLTHLQTEIQQTLRLQASVCYLPVFWQVLTQLPLLRDGSVDEHALTTIISEQHNRANQHDAVQLPQTETEYQLALLWQQLLYPQGEATALASTLAQALAQNAALAHLRVGRNSDFFQSGGHSILVTQLANRIQQQFGVSLPLKQLFDTAELAQQAQQIDALLENQSAGQSDERAQQLLDNEKALQEYDGALEEGEL